MIPSIFWIIFRQISEKRDSINEVKETLKSKLIIKKSVSFSEKPADEQKLEGKKAPGTSLIEEENVATGNISFKIYNYYAKTYGVFGTLMTIFGIIFYQGSNIATNYWLSIWSANSLNETCYKEGEPNCTDFYLGIYGFFGFGQIIGTVILSLTIFLHALNASEKMHNSMLNCIVRGPMAFFDTTPIGRVMNRFTKERTTELSFRDFNSFQNSDQK